MEKKIWIIIFLIFTHLRVAWESRPFFFIPRDIKEEGTVYSKKLWGRVSWNLKDLQIEMLKFQLVLGNSLVGGVWCTFAPNF